MSARRPFRMVRASVLVGLTAFLMHAASGEIQILDRFARPTGPVGLSALTHVEGDRYYAVDDRGGQLYGLTIALDEKGQVRSFATNRTVRLAGRIDLEGCAWDPLEKRIWVSDEADASIRQFDPATGAETAVAPLPDVFRREARPNRAIEALAISPDGLRLYAANEDTLRCDGEVATTNRGGVVRIQEFARAGAGHPWKATRQFRFRTHRIRGADWQGRAVSGVSALAVRPDGSLLVLEREFSQKALPLPTFHLRLVCVRLPAGADGKLQRDVLLDRTTGLANYEGLAPGPTLPDGTRPWLLVSDADGGAEPSILVLRNSASDSIRLEKSVPVAHRVDVMVVGGGPAGVAAAVTAAEAGRKVLLVEQTGSFGGAGTVGGVPQFMNFSDGEHFLAGGFGRRVFDALYTNENPVARSCPCVDTERVKRLYDRLVKESGADFRFYTRLTDVIVKDGRVSAAVVSDPDGTKAVVADVYVDATGSGFLCHLAGVPSDYGNEKGVPASSTLCSVWGGVDFARKRGDGRFTARAFKDGVLTQYDTCLPGIFGNYRDVGVGLGNVGHVFAVDDRSAKSLTDAMVKGRASLAEYEAYYRRYVAGCEKATLVRSADALGVRASRRVRCEKTLAIEHFSATNRFADEIGRYNYPIDRHPLSPDAKGMAGFVQAIHLSLKDGESYSIPYGALVPVGVENVLVAGRAIGADDSMQASVRVIPGCFITGQAAGLGAALASERGCAARDVPIGELQRRLRAVGAYIPRAGTAVAESPCYNNGHGEGRKER